MSNAVQAKRANIGISLITNPRVLFLDEPTSGLDSYTAHEVHPQSLLPSFFTWAAVWGYAARQIVVLPAWSQSYDREQSRSCVLCVQVMTVVRGLVKRGITICATIHCPPPHTFTLFDRALIMQRGRVVYFGLNGQPAIDYFYDHFPKASTLACSRSFPLRWTPQGVLAQMAS